MWASGRLVRDLETLRPASAGSPSSRVFRGIYSATGPLLASTGVAIVFAVSTLVQEGVLAGIVSGKVTLLTFLDSQCTDACPVIAVDLARGIDALSPSERADVVAVALSVDPDEDTRASVDRFLRARHALGRIRYLVTPADTLKRLWGEFLILPSVRSGSDSIHSAPVRISGAAVRG
jgi:SCO1/SenC